MHRQLLSRILGTAFLAAAVGSGGCRDATWQELGALTAPVPAGASPSEPCSGLILGEDGTGQMLAAASTGGPNGEVDTFAATTGQGSADGLAFNGALQARPDAVGWFGVSVSLWKGELAVGASHDDPQRIDNGYVDLYVRSSTLPPALNGGSSSSSGWTLEETVVLSSVTPPPVDTGSTEFGFARAIDLSGDDLVVGAGRFAGGYGRAFLFHRNYGIFQQVAEWNEGDQQRFDANFGDSVKVDGDTAVVTRPDTPASTGEGSKAGKVYVYARASASGKWFQQQVLQSPVADGSYDGFGTAVALAGDQLAVRSSTTVWLFSRTQGTWTNVWQTPAGSAGRDSIALSSSYLAIGEPATAVGDAAGAGSVRLFANGGDAFTEVATRTDPTAVAGHGFGTRVALNGERLLVGAAALAAQADQGSATFAYMEGADSSGS